MRFAVLPTAAFFVLLAGCAGYNHTLFLTKSNVGLDYTAKEPSVQLSVARSEAVIAPSFERGQTPPVIASFKPEVGSTGAFKNFFMGVDQTFAGGDAAVAMAKLYSANKVGSESDYASSLRLQNKPSGAFWLTGIPGDGSRRPFVFGTDTVLGLKAKWTGATGPVPDTVNAGFSRKELAWAPLSYSPTNESGENGHFVKMASFLATIDSEQRIQGQDTVVEALQYFATGRAATLLSLQPDVRKAMLARLDPNQEKFKSKFRGDLSPQAATSARVAMTSLFDVVEKEKDKPLAAPIYRKCEGIAVQALPNKYEFTWFDDFDDGAKQLHVRKQKDDLVVVANPPPPRFQSLMRYWEALEQSKTYLAKASTNSNVRIGADGASAQILNTHTAEVEKSLKSLVNVIEVNNPLPDLLEYVLVK